MWERHEEEETEKKRKKKRKWARATAVVQMMVSRHTFATACRDGDGGCRQGLGGFLSSVQWPVATRTASCRRPLANLEVRLGSFATARSDVDSWVSLASGTLTAIFFFLYPPCLSEESRERSRVPAKKRFFRVVSLTMNGSQEEALRRL